MGAGPGQRFGDIAVRAWCAAPGVNRLTDMDAKGSLPEPQLNVLGGPLEDCGFDPVTGFFRDGSCTTCAEDMGSHTVCAVVTAEFLAHQRSLGNDLVTPVPEWGFPGLAPGDRWCVVAARWLQSYAAGVAAPVVLAATNAAVLEIVPLRYLRACSVDIPDDPSSLLG